MRQEPRMMSVEERATVARAVGKAMMVLGRRRAEIMARKMGMRAPTLTGLGATLAEIMAIAAKTIAKYPRADVEAAVRKANVAMWEFQRWGPGMIETAMEDYYEGRPPAHVYAGSPPPTPEESARRAFKESIWTNTKNLVSNVFGAPGKLVKIGTEWLKAIKKYALIAGGVVVVVGGLVVFMYLRKPPVQVTVSKP